jgi:trans-aconitate 2-methyltransferase
MPWNPAQYAKFSKERAEPFAHLCALVRFSPAMRMVDLGCGTGELTVELAKQSPGARAVGVDQSPEMIARARQHETPAVRFLLGDLERIGEPGAYDLVFSHAALHWVEAHPQLVPALFALARPGGGQIAWQIPANHNHPAHRLISERLIREEPFERALAGFVRRTPVLEVDAYASLLQACGAHDIVAMERVYGHELASVEAVVEWTRATTLLPYLERLPLELHEPFLDRYRALLRQELGQPSPFYYTFRRILLCAVRG